MIDQSHKRVVRGVMSAASCALSADRIAEVCELPRDETAAILGQMEKFDTASVKDGLWTIAQKYADPIPVGARQRLIEVLEKYGPMAKSNLEVLCEFSGNFSAERNRIFLGVLHWALYQGDVVSHKNSRGAGRFIALPGQDVSKAIPLPCKQANLPIRKKSVEDLRAVLDEGLIKECSEQSLNIRAVASAFEIPVSVADIAEMTGIDADAVRMRLAADGAQGHYCRTPDGAWMISPEWRIKGMCDDAAALQFVLTRRGPAKVSDLIETLPWLEKSADALNRLRWYGISRRLNKERRVLFKTIGADEIVAMPWQIIHKPTRNDFVQTRRTVRSIMSGAVGSIEGTCGLLADPNSEDPTYA